MRDFFRDVRDPGDRPENSGSVDRGEALENQWQTISVRLLEYLRGHEESRLPLRNALVELSIPEQALTFGRILQTIEAFSPPYTHHQARAAFALAEMSYGLLDDNGARLFQKAEHFAEHCEDLHLEREAMLRRAGLLYEADQNPNNLAHARVVIKAALALGSSGAPREGIQFMRAYTLMGKCYLAESCGSVEKEAQDVAAALESHFHNNREELLALLWKASEVVPFKAIIEAELLVAQVLTDESDTDEIRMHYESLLGIVGRDGPLSPWGEVAVLNGYAAALRRSCLAANPEAVTPSGIAADFDVALGVIRDARTLIEAQGGYFEDGVLHGKVLLEEAVILYELGDIKTAHKSFAAARDKLMQEAERDTSVMNSIEYICDLLDQCEEELQANDGADGYDDAAESN